MVDQRDHLEQVRLDPVVSDVFGQNAGNRLEDGRALIAIDVRYRKTEAMDADAGPLEMYRQSAAI